MARLRNNGGVVGPAVTINSSSASGLFHIIEANQYIALGTFPRFLGNNNNDNYFPYTTLLLHADGTNGANNSVFLDSSTNNLTVTKLGTPTQGTFSPFSTTGWSAYVANRPQIQNGVTLSGDFTIEMWLNASSWAAQPFIIDSRINNNSNLNFYLQTAGASADSVSTFITWTDFKTNVLNTWNHIALTRSGSTVYAYLNGNLLNSATFANSISLGYLNFMSRWDGTYASNSYVSNFRIVNGNALYSGTGSFTPPLSTLTNVANTAYLCFHKSNGFSTEGSIGTAVTPSSNTNIVPFSPFSPTSAYSNTVVGGSMYFNGSTDYLTIPYSSVFDFNSGSSVSFEAWVYPTSYTNPIFLANRNWSYGGGGPTWGFKISNATAIDWAIAGTGSATYELLNPSSLVAPYNIPLYAWSHVVFTRDASGNAKIFVNGYLVAAGNYTSSLSSATGSVYIGIPSSGGNYSQCYISNMRLVANNIPSAYQTSSTTVGALIFTPPTQPFTASSTANTTLLLNATNAGIIDSSQKVSLITYGSAAISSTQSKFGGTSIYYNGSTDYIQGTVQAPGTGDFTLEGWVNFSAVPTNVSAPTFFSIIGSSSSTGFQPYATTSGWGIRNNTQNILGTAGGSGIGTAPTIGQWYHVAIVRYSGVIKMYINGVSAGSTSTSYTFSDTTFSSGWCATGSTGIYFNGYVDEIRYTKGYARYTANFTPQTSAFLNQ